MSDIKTDNTKTATIDPSHLFNEKDFFLMQQPMSYFCRIQFRIPSFIGELFDDSGKNSGKTNNYKVIDEYGFTNLKNSILDQREGRLLVEKVIIDDTKQLYEYWVDITIAVDKVSGAHKYINNFVDAMAIEDQGGIKTFDITLYDKYWRNIEGLLAIAAQCIYWNDQRQEFAIDRFNYANTGAGERGSKPLAVHNMFINPGSLETVRIKFGYPRNYIAPGLIGKKVALKEKGYIGKDSSGTPIIFTDGGDFTQQNITDLQKYAKRSENDMCLETPWIRGIILEIKRTISQEGMTFNIKATSPISVMMDKVELRKEFAIINADTRGILNIINAPINVYLADNLINPDKATKDAISTKKFGNVNEFVQQRLREFFENYYNSSDPFDKSLGGEEPRNIWGIPNGGTKIVPLEIKYQMLDEPPSDLYGMPISTLGTILDEIMLKIPPKRYARQFSGGKWSGMKREIFDSMKDAKDFYTGKGVTKSPESYSEEYLAGSGDVLPSPWKIIEEESKIYKWRIISFEKQTDLALTGNRLILYYDDVPTNYKQLDYRIYQPRHHQSVVETFTIDEDKTFELIMSNNFMSFDQLTTGNTIPQKIGDVFKEKTSFTDISDSLERILPDLKTDLAKIKTDMAAKTIDCSDTDMITKLKSIVESAYKDKLSDKNKKDMIINNLNFGSTRTANGTNASTIKTMGLTSANKMTIVILGDPYWLFDSKITAAIYKIIVNVKRPQLTGSGDKTSFENDPFYSGQYYVLGIKHNIDYSNAFTTTLTLQKIPALSDTFEDVGAITESDNQSKDILQTTLTKIDDDNGQVIIKKEDSSKDMPPPLIENLGISVKDVTNLSYSGDHIWAIEKEPEVKTKNGMSNYNYTIILYYWSNSSSKYKETNPLIKNDMTITLKESVSIVKGSLDTQIKEKLKNNKYSEDFFRFSDDTRKGKKSNQ